MLGDGMVSFGVALATDFRNWKSSPKMHFSSFSLLLMRNAPRVASTSPPFIAELDFQAFSAPGNAADPVEEIHVPRAAAILTVGNAPEPDVLLHLHRFADGLVLNATQFGSRDAALLMLLARLKYLFPPQEAANVIGA